MATTGTLTMTLTSVSGDSVDPGDYIKAWEKTKPLIKRGATSGTFSFSYGYVSTGSNETAEYQVQWSIK